MEHFKVNGIWEDADVYQFFNLDEAKQHKTLCNNYKNILKKFKQVLNKTPNNLPGYKVIGLEDNQAWDDYYWILEDARHHRRYLQCTDDKFFD